MVSRKIFRLKEFIIEYYDFNRKYGNEDINFVGINNIITKKINDSLYTFYQDTNLNLLLYYIYFFYNKKYYLDIENNNYIIYC